MSDMTGTVAVVVAVESALIAAKIVMIGVGSMINTKRVIIDLVN